MVFCGLRHLLTLRDVSETVALRGIEASHEAVRNWFVDRPAELEACWYRAGADREPSRGLA